MLHYDRMLYPLGETSMVIVEKLVRRVSKELDKVPMLSDFFFSLVFDLCFYSWKIRKFIEAIQ